MSDIENYISMLSLCGGTFVLAGFVMYLFPPKNINSLYGYRTKLSMKNQQNWDFAQKNSTLLMILLGFLYLLVSYIFTLLSLPEYVQLIIEFLLLFSGIGAMFWKVEKEIKKQQTEKKNT